MMIHEMFNLFNWLGSEWVLAILGILSVMVLAITLQRWFELRGMMRQSLRFWNDIGNRWVSGEGAKWKQEFQTVSEKYDCLETETLDVIHRAQQTGPMGGEVLEAYLDHKRMKMERNVSILGTIGANAAFLGLLGTVLGVIRAFSDLQTQGLGAGADSIGGGIAEALVATAVGLCVAIPAVVCFNMFNQKISGLIRKARSVGAVALNYQV